MPHNRPPMWTNEDAERQQQFGDERQHQPASLKCKFCKGIVFVPCNTFEKAQRCTSLSARLFGITWENAMEKDKS